MIRKLSHTDCLLWQRVGTQTSAGLKYVILFALILGVLVGVALGLKYVMHFGSRSPPSTLPAPHPLALAAPVPGVAGCLLVRACPLARAHSSHSSGSKRLKHTGNMCAHHRPGLSVDDLTADPDFDWVAKWTQVVPQLAQAFNFVMMATVRATASETVK